MGKFIDLFKKPKGVKPLPNYPKIGIANVPPASALIFYGSPGNKATELVGSRLYKFKYNPVPFHAALYLDKGEFLNVGKFKTVESLKDNMKNTRRIDVIEYAMSDEQLAEILYRGRRDTSKPKHPLDLTDYAVTDFLRFGLRFLKPSKKDFCSENVVENMAHGGIKVSDLKAVDTAPWDLLEFAEANPHLCRIYTLYEGDEFTKRLGR